MSGDADAERRRVILLGDLGSTFTKVLAVDDRGLPLGRAMAPTSRDELDHGFLTARAQLSALGIPVEDAPTLMSSSAAGGLRLVIIGLEPSLTVKFGRMAASTAGGRIVAAWGLYEFESLTNAEWAGVLPDVVVLTGGTDGGDVDALPRAAQRLRDLSFSGPVVVAGNQRAYGETQRILDGSLPVRYVANVMPRIGALELSPVRTAIRDVFIEHVIGRGRFSSASSLVGLISMPTPDAVLLAAERLAAMGSDEPLFANPLIVDVGGATTDVHSVLPRARQLASGAGLGPGPRRTVEADLGVRESAASLLDAAAEAGWLTDVPASVVQGAHVRGEDRSFVPDTPRERDVDKMLATTATALALHRHAGVLEVNAGAGGIRVVPTGRDVRRATVVVATGGVFRHMSDPEAAVSAALATSGKFGGLTPPPSTQVLIDHSYVLWAAGLLSSTHPRTAEALLRHELLTPVGGS